MQKQTKFTVCPKSSSLEIIVEEKIWTVIRIKHFEKQKQEK